MSYTDEEKLRMFQVDTLKSGNAKLFPPDIAYTKSFVEQAVKQSKFSTAILVVKIIDLFIDVYINDEGKIKFKFVDFRKNYKFIVDLYNLIVYAIKVLYPQ